jgi:hypothetical protein
MTVKGERVLKAAAVAIFLVMIAAVMQSAWAAKGDKLKPDPQPGVMTQVDADG